MATYKEIQAHIKAKHGFTVKTCWIAHAKELCGIKTRKPWNRQSNKRCHPCPDDKLSIIKEAFKHFKII